MESVTSSYWYRPISGEEPGLWSMRDRISSPWRQRPCSPRNAIASMSRRRFVPKAQTLRTLRSISSTRLAGIICLLTILRKWDRMGRVLISIAVVAAHSMGCHCLLSSTKVVVFSPHFYINYSTQINIYVAQSII